MSKISKTILFAFFLLSISCINDFAFYHNSALESRQKGLLLKEYNPNKPEIEIANEKYKIIEAWTAYKFKSRGSKEIYKEIIAFTFILENSMKDRKPDVELIGIIECKNNDVLFDKRVGIDDSQYRVFFNKKSINKIDTVKFVIKNNGKVFDSINFIKNTKKSVQ
jgi:hypothetical protein